MAAGSARFVVPGLYELRDGTGLQHAGAIPGLALAAVALYSALATEVEDVQGKTKLPLGRRAMTAEPPPRTVRRPASCVVEARLR
jgi:uncharacterized protein